MAKHTRRLTWAWVVAVGWGNVLAGALIYVLARSEFLLVFRWLETLGLHSTVAAARDYLGPAMETLSDFILFSYPDGAWVFGFVCQMAWTWRDRPGLEASLWVSLGPILGLAGELGQLVGWVPGTFDISDLLAMVGMWGLARALIWRVTRVTGASHANTVGRIRQTDS